MPALTRRVYGPATGGAGSRLARLSLASNCGSVASRDGSTVVASSVSIWAWFLGLFAGCGTKCTPGPCKCTQAEWSDCDAKDGTCSCRQDADCHRDITCAGAGEMMPN